MSQKLKWTIEIEVDPAWVTDGFNMTDARAKRMLEQHLPYAEGSELDARVISAPDDSLIADLQGYKSVADMKADGNR